MSRHADHAQVAAAFALPMVLVAVAGWFAWSETWNRAEGELLRTADGAAELADRVVGAAALAARLTNTALTGMSDEELQRNELRYHRQIAGIMEELPGSNMISVSDRAGTLILMSAQYPSTRVSVADREWVKALQREDSPEIFVGALSVGRVAGLPFFSISIPRSGAGNGRLPGEYDGNVNVSLDPHVIARELRMTTQEDADVISLIRADGEILASTRGDWTEAPRVPPTSPLLGFIAQGMDRGLYEGRTIGLREGLPLGGGLQIAFNQVGALPLYTTVSRTPAAIVAPWLRTMLALLAVGLPTSLALGMLSLTSLRRRNALGKSEAELRAAFENAATGTALIDSRTNRILKVNRRLREIAGRDAPDLIGMDMGHLLQPYAEDTGTSGTETGEAGPVLHQLARPDGGIRWIELGMAPVTSARIGDPSLTIATFHDITERQEGQERQILLAREVDHRAKNVLAIVQAVVRMERGAGSYAKRIEGRIHALARAHELLAKDRWQGASLRALIEDELAAYEGGVDIRVEGRDVVISSDAVQPLSMVLHELASNAVKHGALAHPAGRLTISWTLPVETGRLRLVWHEEAAPGVAASSISGGTGLTIIEGSVDQLGGEVALDWRDGGLVCSILLPRDAVASSKLSDPVNTNAPPGGEPSAEPRDFTGLRVLLAEDEILVAMDMQELLERIGCKVIGPAYSLGEARQLADGAAGRLDVAVLDVNLKGDLSLDLARQLEREGVGVLLVTGYSEVPGTRKSDGWVRLRKPVSEASVVEVLRRFAAARQAQPDEAGAPAI